MICFYIFLVVLGAHRCCCQILLRDDLNLDTFPQITETNINIIKASKNNICSIPKNAFENITVGLTFFEMNKNCLSEFPDFGYHKTTLQQIWLNNNQITYIPTEKFFGLENLYRLWLLGNPFITMPDFSPLAESGFQLTWQIAMKGFHGSYWPPFAKKLHLAETVFTERGIEISDLYGVATTLEILVLDLAPPMKTIITKEDMKPFEKLKDFLLITGLERLPDFTYQRDSITSIDVRSPVLKTLALPELAPILSESSNKFRLELSYTKIKRIPGFKDMKKTLTKLLLPNIHCDCRVHDVIKELQENDRIFVNIPIHPCASPAHLKSEHYSTIDLSELKCTESVTRDDVSGTLKVYETFQDGARKPGPYLESMVTAHALKCARKCRSHPYCWSFNFNEGTGLCDLVGHQEVGYGNNASPGTVSYDLKDV